MPIVLGPGPYKSLRRVSDLHGSYISKESTGLQGFVVPWGFYYYQYGNQCTLQMATAALNSCIAVICSYNQGQKVFFAHVSSDGEAAHIVKAIRRVDPSRSDKYTCIAVLGVNPQNATTLKRLTSILDAARYPFHIYQSKQGAVSYQTQKGLLEFGANVTTQSTVPRRLATTAMMKRADEGLTPIDGSLDLDSQ